MEATNQTSETKMDPTAELVVERLTTEKLSQERVRLEIEAAKANLAYWQAAAECKRIEARTTELEYHAKADSPTGVLLKLLDRVQRLEDSK